MAEDAPLVEMIFSWLQRGPLLIKGLQRHVLLLMVMVMMIDDDNIDGCADGEGGATQQR